MTASIGIRLRGIVLLFVLAGLIAGHAGPSLCDASYNTLLKLNSQFPSLSASDTGPACDCIFANPENSSLPESIIRRDRGGHHDLFKLLCIDGAWFARSGTLPERSCSIVQSTILSSSSPSYYHIIFIHLKDGGK